MLDAPQMFPEGFHPELQTRTPDFSRRAKARRRRLTRSVKYCFIDFGISSSFESLDQRERVRGWSCQDKTVPELKTGKPYDPFKVDIYTVGNVFKTTLTEVLLHDSAVRPCR